MLTVTLLIAALVVFQDPATSPGLGDVGILATAAVGLASSLLLGAGKKAADSAARAVTGVDAKVSKFIGPAYPLVTFGLAYLLPKLGNAVGVTDVPDASVMAAAPVATLIGITAREVFRRWILPKRA